MTTVYERLKLSKIIYGGEVKDIRDFLINEVTRRSKIPDETDLTTVGTKILYLMAKALLSNIQTAGQTAESEAQGKLAHENVMKQYISVAKALYEQDINTSYGPR